MARARWLAASRSDRSFERPLAVVLGLLTIFGPISMDLYLPVLPALTAELRSATSTAQLTITACLFGLALGQLIAGPLSDRFGRRRPLLAGVAAYVLTSASCAISPTIETLIAARFVQGLAGTVGIVIAQAAGRDLYSGRALVRYYGRLTVLAGLAAIIGPVIGGQLGPPSPTGAGCSCSSPRSAWPSSSPRSPFSARRCLPGVATGSSGRCTPDPTPRGERRAASHCPPRLAGARRRGHRCRARRRNAARTMDWLLAATSIVSGAVVGSDTMRLVASARPSAVRAR
ncbi:MFS transporter [Nonomuraea jabiensis]|uniref:MFS transporter n=1 Tax=Nonomuraea jabiensis TaxID=882448 RepID=UPI00342F2B5E